MEEEAFVWVKKNKLLLVSEFITDLDILSVENPVSVFMAGVPGAGKTEVAKRLIEEFSSKPVHIDADSIRQMCPGYSGDNSSTFQKAANKGVNILYDYCLEHGHNLILDGTFAYGDAVSNLERSMSRDRVSAIYYIYQAPRKAWEFTKARELEEGRMVPKEVFISSYLNSRNNIAEIKRIYGSDVVLNLIIKDLGGGSRKNHFNISSIDHYLSVVYSEEELREIIDK